jgi:tRNA-dihydrouridine synthase
MVGRGAYGAPWMPGRIGRFLETGRDPGDPDLATQCRIARGHVQAMFAHYPGDLGIKNARKHIGWYLVASGRPEPIVKAWRKQLCTQWQPQVVLDGLAQFYAEPERIAA